MSEIQKSEQVTIVVNTCDSYADVLGLFFCGLNRFWPDCPYPIVINAEMRKYDYSAGVHNYFADDGVDDWGKRLCLTLDSIQSEYVLMLYDDFVLNSFVNNDYVSDALNRLRSEEKAVVAYLIDISLPLKSSNGIELFQEIKDRVDFKLNSAPAIWRKKYLMNYVAPGDTPWAWEVFGSYRAWGDGNLYFALKHGCDDIYPYNHTKGGAIYRGKWVREVVEQAQAVFPIQIDWNQRGFSSDTRYEKRPFSWKMRFMQTGFRMVGFKALNFLIGYIRAKCHAS